MKTSFVSLASLLVTAAAFAQRTVAFDNHVPGVVVTHVYEEYWPDTYPGKVGNGANDWPAGATVWNGPALEGTNWMAQLLAAPGANQPAALLLEAISPPTTFRAGAAAGFVNATTAVFANVPKDAPSATVQMAVWDNSSGRYQTWTDAKRGYDVLRATSPTFNLFAIGGDINTPPNLVGLVSFGVYLIPEPAVSALAALSLVLLLILRRRKSLALFLRH